MQDEHGATSTSSVTITVTGTNDAPVAQAASNSLFEDASVSGNVGATDADDESADVVLVGVGLLTFLVGHSGPSTTTGTFVLVGIVVVGVGLVIGPFLWRLVQQVDAERREKLLSQQQADVAAHLHDSVLQTLALIQRKADDPRAVVALARAQERDLRAWLYEDPAAPTSSLRAALEDTAAEVETLHGVPVEVVLVGDAALDDGLHDRRERRRSRS